MNTFLNKISTLDPIQDVLFLSTQGKPLFFKSKKNVAESSNTLFSYWHEIISDLDQPIAAEFAFTKGTYYLTRTDIGYLIIGLKDETALPEIQQACAGLLKKLSNPLLCKRALLDQLGNSNDLIKINIIKGLVPYADTEVASVLIPLLQRENNFAPEVKEQLLLLLCQTLGYCRSFEAVAALEYFLSRHGTATNTPGSQITEAVNLSIKQLKRDTPEATQTAATAPPEKSPNVEQKGTRNRKKEAPATQTKAIPQLNIPQQQKIVALLEKGRKDEALALITQLIESFARKKQFETADRLRDWLIQINPMALLDIIRAADTIEAEKQAAINKDHLKTWKELIDVIGSEEFASLYHAMTLKSYVDGQTIVRQGSSARTLLFVNSGRVQIQAVSRNRLVPLTAKDAGKIIGTKTFFEASVWTTNVKSLGCELFLLSPKKFNYLKERYTSLESKLSDFCSRYQSSSAQLQKSSKNRRQFERKSVSGRMVFVILDQSGKAISNEVKGSLIDISIGGMAFSIHSSQKKNAISLFGRQLRVTLNAGMASNVLVRKGTVHAVRDMDLIGNEYSLHIKFSQELDYSELQQIVNK